MCGMQDSYLLRLIVAVICGALIGLEREINSKPAGLRTNMLICLGSCLFTFASLELSDKDGDPGRIAAQIVTGIGFIGAGTILRHGRDSISGLTSAATVWLVASVGILLGTGRYTLGIAGTIAAFIILTGCTWVERKIGRNRIAYTIHLAAPDEVEILLHIQQAFRSLGIVTDTFSVISGAEARLTIQIHFSTSAVKRQQLLDVLGRIEKIEPLNPVRIHD